MVRRLTFHWLYVSCPRISAVAYRVKYVQQLTCPAHTPTVGEEVFSLPLKILLAGPRIRLTWDRLTRKKTNLVSY